MRIYTLMMSLLIVALAAAGCSQPEPVRAEYEPADCEEAEASVEEDQAEQQAVDEEAEADRWQEPEAADEELTVALEDVEEADQAGDQADEQAGDEDGEAVEEASVEETSDEPAERAGTGVVNLNDASINQLMELPGVGPALAARIVEFRQQRRFEKPDHLLRVRGIGESTFAKLAPMLAVDGPTTLAK